jgi:hypothetical protein
MQERCWASFWPKASAGWPGKGGTAWRAPEPVIVSWPRAWRRGRRRWSSGPTAMRCPAQAQEREGGFAKHDAEDDGSPRWLVDGGSAQIATMGHVWRSTVASVKSCRSGGTRGVTEPLEPKEFGGMTTRIDFTVRVTVVELQCDSDMEEGLRWSVTVEGGGGGGPQSGEG